MMHGLVDTGPSVPTAGKRSPFTVLIFIVNVTIGDLRLAVKWQLVGRLYTASEQHAEADPGKENGVVASLSSEVR
jgi:hypothetical protein